MGHRGATISCVEGYLRATDCPRRELFVLSRFVAIGGVAFGCEKEGDFCSLLADVVGVLLI